MKEIVSSWIQIAEIEEIEEKIDVYDITVEDNHNFYANNILVHNCLGGIYSNRIMRGNALNKSDSEIQAELMQLSERFVDAVGEDNFYLELQFNRLKQQHLVNHHLLRHSTHSGVKLISTPDSHYYKPDKWEARELYKKLGWMGNDPSPLPEFEDLKCELYPKNADQMWKEFVAHYDDYKETYQGFEQVVKDSIERTHDIAWEKCTDTWIDTAVKLPDFNKPDQTAFQQLAQKVKQALVKEGLHEKEAYVERAKMELSDIKHLGFENYFLVMNEVFHKAADHTLFGAARGSGGGSLVNYLLGITQVDPLKYDLLWERFLGRHRCVDPSTYVIAESGKKMIKDLEEGEKVLTHTGDFRRVIDKEEAVHDMAVKVKFGGQQIICSPNHRWIIVRDSEQMEVMACHLQKGDKLIKNTSSK